MPVRKKPSPTWSYKMGKSWKVQQGWQMSQWQCQQAEQPSQLASLSLGPAHALAVAECQARSLHVHLQGTSAQFIWTQEDAL